MRRSFRLFAILFTLGLVASFQPVYAQTLDALKTPPAALASLTPSELNAFGMRAINEAYARLSKVGSKTGEIGGRLNQDDKNAVKNARALLDDKALIQSARLSYGITKKTYTPTDIDNFKTSDVSITLPANGIMVASYKVSLPNRVDLKTQSIMSGQTVPRLTVLRWDAKQQQWKIFSHADFDTPSATLCGAPSGIKPRRAQFNEADIALARRILDRQFASAVKGHSTEELASGFQLVYASGEQRGSQGPINYRFAQKPKLSDIEATRNGNLLAIRFNGPGATSFNGRPVDPSVKPRLLTYLKNDQGEWQRIAAAIFSVTARVAADVQCVMPTVR